MSVTHFFNCSNCQKKVEVSAVTCSECTTVDVVDDNLNELSELRMIFTQPIDMLIFCPSCGKQHVDEASPNVCEKCGFEESAHGPEPEKEGNWCPGFTAWQNPPHKSHRCDNCNSVFRVADIPTNGVADIKTRGDHDTWPEASNG